MIGQHESGIRKLVEQFKPLLALGDALKEIGSLEQHAAEIQGSIVRLTKERDALVAESATAKKKADDATAAAKADAATMLKEAEQKATDILRTAQDKAATIEDEEKGRLKRVRADILASEQKLERLKSMSEAEATTVAQRKAELDTLQAKLDEARAALRKTLGI